MSTLLELRKTTLLVNRMNHTQFTECKKLVSEFNEQEELDSSNRVLIKRVGIFVILDDNNDSTKIYSITECKSILAQLHQIYNEVS